MNQVLIYSESFSKRSQYILKTMLDDFLGLNVQLTNERKYFSESKLPKFSYLEKGIEHIPNIFYSGMIDSEELYKMEFPQQHNFTMDSLHISYDVFAFCFFMLSRIEEYNSVHKDAHGRFIAEKSLVAKNNTLHIPVVDVFTDALKKWLAGYFPELVFPPKRPSAILTFDIDIAFALKAKPFLRQTGKFAEELGTLQFGRLSERIAVLSGFRRDPFDIYDDLEKLSLETHIPMIFFFHVVSGGKFDRAAQTNCKDFKNLVKKISEFATIGIHPSYSCGQNSKNIIREKSILEEITGNEVIHSRQHFLRLSLPQTARELAKAGIRYDFTMGYAEEPGWRAGTCKPFKLFNAATNEVLPLTTFPVSFMDGTLREHLNLTTDEAVRMISEILAITQKFNGTFVPLWHNETISETGKWKGWRHNVYDLMIGALQKNFNNT